jgi:hypothetical protein
MRSRHIRKARYLFGSSTAEASTLVCKNSILESTLRRMLQQCTKSRHFAGLYRTAHERRLSLVAACYHPLGSGKRAPWPAVSTHCVHKPSSHACIHASHIHATAMTALVHCPAGLDMERWRYAHIAVQYHYRQASATMYTAIVCVHQRISLGNT